MLCVTWLSRNSARVISTVVIEQIINLANNGRPFLVCCRTWTISSLLSTMLVFSTFSLFFFSITFCFTIVEWHALYIRLCELVFHSHNLNYCYFSNDAYVRSKIKEITQLWVCRMLSCSSVSNEICLSTELSSV